MPNNLAVKAEHVSKVYRLGEIGTGTLSQDFERWLARVRGKEDPFLKIGESNDRTTRGSSSVVYSLNDVNFEVEQGTAVGLIGKNGAGKSTLLKIMSRVTSPSAGRLLLNGRVASLLEVGTGFNQELTGRENIYVNGAILGMKKKEIARKFDEIVDFAGVERYIDTPVKRYSSGMYVRLAFAVAANLDCEIMLVDEVLAVGDAEFQARCLGKMRGVMRDQGRTIIFVSHDMNAISKLCTRAILLENGTVRQDGPVTTVVSNYLSMNSNRPALYEDSQPSSRPIYFKSIRVVDADGKPCNTFYVDEPIFLSFELGINEPDFNCDLFLTVLDGKKRRVFSCESQSIRSSMTLRIEPWQLTRGSYSIETFLNIPRVTKLQHLEDVCDFRVVDNASQMMKHGSYDYGVVLGRYQWDAESREAGGAR
jgi:lipopolysaccharide transport system ATP-binding protein